MRRLSLLSVLFLSILFCAAVHASDSGFIPDLFQSATLDDFNYFLADGAKKEDTFAIKDGVLTVQGSPFGWLETKKSYRNFELKGEFRYPEADKAINSGFFLRINGERTHFLPRCIEMQLMPEKLGDLYTFRDMAIDGEDSRYVENKGHKVVKVMRGVKKYQKTATEDLSQWQSVEILCVGDLITVRINGRLANWATDVEDLAGPIGFQSEGGLVQFRKISIREFP